MERTVKRDVVRTVKWQTAVTDLQGSVTGAVNPGGSYPHVNKVTLYPSENCMLLNVTLDNICTLL
jgi:hypothetical protein